MPVQTLREGLWSQNPALVQLLGLCPLMAVSTSFETGLYLGITTLFIMLLGNALICGCRGFIAPHLRLPSFMLIFATVTTVAELALQAVDFALYTQLGLFLPLIITNCMLLARAEAFASRNPLRLVFYDALAMGLGFLIVLLLMGLTRQLLTPYSVFFAIPPGAFFLFALGVALHKWWREPRRPHQIQTLTLEDDT